jgi:hypothetical protein
MSATNLKFPFLNSMSRFARRSLAITLLPAGSWGIYQMFGENGLIAIAVALPLLWALFGGFEQTETLDDVIPLLPQNPNFFMGYDAEIV